MARYEFKLPDIGEGIAEAEIVAWHVKVGDAVEEDQQLADMMTDKATVEMESPVAGKVLEVAGEVGDMIPIGSVLVVIETEGAAAAAPSRSGEEPIADGMAGDAAKRREERGPDHRRRRREERRTERRRTRRSRTEGRDPPRRQGEWRAQPAPATAADAEAKPLASPAVRAARARSRHRPRQVNGGDRIRHADLDAYLLYSGGGVAARPRAPQRQDESVKVVGLRRKIAENMQEAKRRIPHFTWSRNMTSPRSSGPAR